MKTWWYLLQDLDRSASLVNLSYQYKLWGFVEEIKRNPFVMWQISERFSVSSPGVLEGFDAGWFYRSCWKCRPFTLMHSWYLRANDCVSIIIAAASATRATSSIGVSYMKHFTSPKIKKSIGVRSGERGGHCTEPPLPIQQLGKTLFRYSLTSRAKCAGAPSCLRRYGSKLVYHIAVYFSFTLVTVTCKYSTLTHRREKQSSDGRETRRHCWNQWLERTPKNFHAFSSGNWNK